MLLTDADLQGFIANTGKLVYFVLQDEETLNKLHQWASSLNVLNGGAEIGKGEFTESLQWMMSTLTLAFGITEANILGSSEAGEEGAEIPPQSEEV